MWNMFYSQNQLSFRVLFFFLWKILFPNCIPVITFVLYHISLQYTDTKYKLISLLEQLWNQPHAEFHLVVATSSRDFKENCKKFLK